MLRTIVLGLILSASAIRSSGTARVLVYTATKGFRHDSIPTAIQALNNASSSINVVFDDTEDETRFTDGNLANYDAVMFVSTTGEVLDDVGKAAFQNYLNLGGNFVGVHSASDSLVNTSFYGQELGELIVDGETCSFRLVGAYFDYHPALQNATVDVLDASHPSVSMLPAQWHIQEEMYNFKSDPRTLGAVVVLSANESSYVDTGTRNFDQGTPHPSAWFQEHGAGVQSGHTAGRSFYTSLGHLNETWEDPLFMAHVLGGLTWALQANTTRAFNTSAVVGSSLTATSSGVPASSTTAPSPASNTSASPSPLISAGQVSIITALLAVAVGAYLWFVFPL